VIGGLNGTLKFKFEFNLIKSIRSYWIKRRRYV